jgi:hypothetical protein
MTPPNEIPRQLPHTSNFGSEPNPTAWEASLRGRQDSVAAQNGRFSKQEIARKSLSAQKLGPTGFVFF